jgi:hypothetical protein
MMEHLRPHNGVSQYAHGGGGMANEDLVPRRHVIEQYIHYDSRKKGVAIPGNINEWDWSSADDLDRRLHSAGFKNGIIAGYTLWRGVSLGQSDLADCAVEIHIFPGLRDR